MLLFFSSRRRHTRYWRDWSSDVCSSDLPFAPFCGLIHLPRFSVLNKSNNLLHSPQGVQKMSSKVPLPPSEFSDLSSDDERSEERRVGKEGRSRWSPYH